jgi:hypothetical protein
MVVALELLQWAVILFLAVMVFGLTRQLGFFLVPRHEQIRQQGPAPGNALKEAFLPPAVAQELRAMMDARNCDGAGIVVIDQACAGCQQLVDGLEQRTQESAPIPVMAIVKTSGSPFLARAREVFDLVYDDREGEAVRSAGIVGTPFALRIDRNLRVVETEVAGFVLPLVESWFTPEARDTANQPGLDRIELTVTSHGGPKEVTQA